MQFFVAFKGALAGQTPFASQIKGIHRADRILRAAQRQFSVDEVELLADVDATSPEVAAFRDEAAAHGDRAAVDTVDLARRGNYGALRYVRRWLAAAALAKLD